MMNCLLRGGAVCAALLAGGSTWGGPILFYDFDDDAGGFENAPEFAAPGLGAAAWLDAAGTGVSDFAGNPGRALADNGWDGGNAFLLEMNVAPGAALDLTAFAFDDLASGSGPDMWQLFVNDVPVASGSTHAAFGASGGSLTGLDGLSGTISIRLEGFGASSGGGTWRIDNFQLSGAVVPAPGALALLAVGAAGARRRRRDDGVRARAESRGERSSARVVGAG